MRQQTRRRLHLRRSGVMIEAFLSGRRCLSRLAGLWPSGREHRMHQHHIPSRTIAVLLAVLTCSSAANAQTVVMRPYTDAENNVWVIGGPTYRVYVEADNTGLNGEMTSGLDVTMNLTSSYISSSAYGKPNGTDFFGGQSMFWEQLNPFGQTTGRASWTGSSNSIGDVVWYDINVAPNAPVGNLTLSLNQDSTYSWGYSADQQPTQLIPLELKLRHAGDTNADTLINALDIAPFVQALTDGGFHPLADTNYDGVTNALDISSFVQLLTGGGGTAATVPEPATLAVVFAAALMTGLRRRGA
jgi:hypothetical protein